MNDNFDEAESQLMEHYQSPVPAELKSELLARLQREMPRRQVGGWLALGAACAAALAVAALAAHPFVLHRDSHPSPVAVGTQNGVNFVPPEPLYGMASRAAGTAMDQQAIEASLIVRAKITGWSGQQIEYDVTRVIYGKLAEKTLRVDFLQNGVESLLPASRKQFQDLHGGKDPSEEELYAQFMQDHNIVKGREVILLLQPVMDRPLSSAIAPKPVTPARYATVALFRDDPPTQKLDPIEAEIVQVIKDGTFLEPLPGRGTILEAMPEERTLAVQWYRAEAVVRAGSPRVTDAGVRWKVQRTFKGSVPAEVLVRDDTFKQRAEAVAAYAALKDAALNDPAKRAELVAVEMKAMMAAELPSTQEAILFLGGMQVEGGNATADLQARVYDTSKRTTLAAVEAAIAPGVTRAPENPTNAQAMFATTTFDDYLARTSLVVQVKLDDYKDMTADCTVLNTIYGETAEKKLQVDMTWGDPEVRKGYEKDAERWFVRDHGRAPTPDELLTQMQYMHSLNKAFIGILLLAPPTGHAANATGKDARYYVVQAHFFSPDTYAPVEQQLIDAFRNGNYLKPNPVFVNTLLLEPKIAAAQAIVRARLTGITATDATWHVEKTLKGENIPDVTLTHELFDQRARGFVMVAALHNPALYIPATRDASIAGERAALIQAELHVGQEALLLLGDVKTTKEGVSARLLGRELQGERDTLATAEAAIQKAIASNPRLALDPGAAVADAGGARPGNFGLSHAFGFPSPEMQVSMAPLIVRARIAGWEDTNVQYTVERVIYGSCDDKTIRQDLTYGDKSVRKGFMDDARKQLAEKGQSQPTDAELLEFMLKDHGIEKGREVIMLLQPRKEGGFQNSGMMFDAPPEYALDKREAEIVQIVRDGGYLENIAGDRDYFAMKLRGAEGIVRAKVAEVTLKGTTWKVEKVIQGKDIGETVEISHELFRRRAEAVAGFAALKDDSLKDPVRREARIAAEMKAMIDAELAPGREAILFLGNLEHDGTATRGQVQYRLYDTSKRMKLDDLEKLIASPASVPDGW